MVDMTLREGDFFTRNLLVLKMLVICEFIFTVDPEISEESRQAFKKSAWTQKIILLRYWEGGAGGWLLETRDFPLSIDTRGARGNT